MSTVATFIIGSTVRVVGRFSDNTGALTAPGTVTLKVRDPSGAENTYTLAGATVTQDAVGNYSKDIVINASGRWAFRWIGTAPVADAIELSLEIPVSAFAAP